MDRPHNRTSLPSSQPMTRLATLTWSLLAILLLAALLFVRQAEAATLASPGPIPVTVTGTVESEEAEDEESEGEEGEEEESEDEEEDEGPGTVGPLLLPPECLLHTAEANVSASAARGVVRLTIHYTSYTPTSVNVDYWLKGSKGSLQLGETKRHFGRQGVIHAEEHVSDHAMSKVLAARAFIVQLGITGAPSSCDRYSTQHLTTKHGGDGHATWSRPR
jgi:hypothetical protein